MKTTLDGILSDVSKVFSRLNSECVYHIYNIFTSSEFFKPKYFKPTEEYVMKVTDLCKNSNGEEVRALIYGKRIRSTGETIPLDIRHKYLTLFKTSNENSINPFIYWPQMLWGKYNVQSYKEEVTTVIGEGHLHLDGNLEPTSWVDISAIKNSPGMVFEIWGFDNTLCSRRYTSDLSGKIFSI